MGIKNLNAFLRKKCPDVFKQDKVSSFSNKIIAIDISLFVFKYKSVYNKDWLRALLNFLVSLLEKNIKIVVIYDNFAPVEKLKEQETRKENRQKVADKAKQLRIDFEHYKKTKEISSLLMEVHKKKSKASILKLSSNIIQEKQMEEYIQSMETQSVKITSDDFKISRELLTHLHIPYYTATSEAEAYCSNLCKNGIIDAVLSEDTDILAYCSPCFISKINTYKDECTVLYIKDILKELDFTLEQFTEFCIMCGTDYNKNIPKIGPQTSYKLLQTHKNIDNIPKDTSILNHKRGKELFTLDPDLTLDLKWDMNPNFNELERFLRINNCDFDIHKIKQVFDS